MAKQFIFHGKTIEELKNMSMKEFIDHLPTRQRRSFNRGLTDAQKRFVKKVEAGKNNIKTHCRDMIVFPNMVGKTIKVHNGNDFVNIIILEEMIGHFLGEYALTRKRLQHSAPGVGATKSSSNVSVK